MDAHTLRAHLLTPDALVGDNMLQAAISLSAAKMYYLPVSPSLDVTGAHHVRQFQLRDRSRDVLESTIRKHWGYAPGPLAPWQGAYRLRRRVLAMANTHDPWFGSPW